MVNYMLNVGEFNVTSELCLTTVHSMLHPYGAAVELCRRLQYAILA